MPKSQAHAKLPLDRLLVERGLADSRARAQALILAGQVLVGEQKVEKCGTRVDAEAVVRLTSEPPKYVSRAGVKLEAALDAFGVNPQGKIALDIGASTGGFTDCLLARGAAKVIAVDVGTNQLAWALRTDPRVVSLENVNARYLSFEQAGARARLATMDVSFISAAKILPQLPALIEPDADLLVLVKPQFEAAPNEVGPGGIVRDPKVQQAAIAKVSICLSELGFTLAGSVESALPGAHGNREFFLHAIWPGNH